MTELTEKENVIKAVYVNQASGFGSIFDTFKQSKVINPNTKISDVKEYLNKQQHRQTQFQYKKYNSFVSPHPLFEIEIDLVDLSRTAEDNNGIRYGFVGIDNFTKYAWVVPIKTKTPKDLTDAMQEIFDKIGVPKQLYSDQEGSFNNASFIQLINKNKVKHIMVVDKAHTVERCNRTLKENIFKRLNALGLDPDKWTSQLDNVVTKYNNTVHSSIKMTPVDARKNDNKTSVSFNIWAKAKRDRVYPEMSLRSEVRVMLTNDNKTKGYVPKWSKEIYKVLFIKDHEYLITNNNNKIDQRHELLKV